MKRGNCHNGIPANPIAGGVISGYLYDPWTVTPDFECFQQDLYEPLPNANNPVKADTLDECLDLCDGLESNL